MKKQRLNFLSSLNHFLTEGIWKIDLSKLSPLKAFFLKHLRIGILVVRRFIKNRVKVRASALVYATLMSIVPLLAVVFSLLKGFGYHNQLEPFLTRMLEPLGDQAIQLIVPNIMNFVGSAKVAALGTIGFLVFLVASISIVKNMELAFNDIWEVESKRSFREAIEKLRSYGALYKSKRKDDAISLLVEEMQGHHEKLLREAFPDTSIRELMDQLNEGQEKT